MKITLKGIVLFVAIAMSAYAGVIATLGLMTLVPGAKVMVGCLGALLEIAQLVAFAWLFRHDSTHVALRVTLAVLSFVVVILDGIGGSAQLSHGFMKQRNAGTIEATQGFATVDAKIEAAKAEVADIDRQIAHVDEQVARANDARVKARDDRDRIKAAIKAQSDSESKRAALTTQRNATAAKVTALQIERGSVKGRELEANGEFVAVQFVAAMFGLTEERVMLTMFAIFGFLPNLFAWVLVAVCHEHTPVVVEKTAYEKAKHRARARKAADTKRKNKVAVQVAASPDVVTMRKVG